MKRRRGLVVLLLALAAGGTLGDPRSRGRLLLAISRTAGAGADALRSLQLAAGARYVDLAFPPEVVNEGPVQE